MKIAPDCVPCLLRRVLYETRLVDARLCGRTVKECAKILSAGFSPTMNSAELATRAHKRAYEIIGIRDPYRELKTKSNVVALKLLPWAKKFISSSKNQFEAAITCSIAANVLDFGILPEFQDIKYFTENFRRLCAEGLGYNDVPRLKKLLAHANEILYFADNCGEIIFDRLVIEKLKAQGSRETKIVLVVRGEPIFTDVTLADAKKLGMYNVVDEILTTNAFAVGVNFKKVSAELREKLETTDLIISKGMANYESFSDTDYRPIAYLLRTKCEPVANSLHVKKDINVCMLVE